MKSFVTEKLVRWNHSNLMYALIGRKNMIKGTRYLNMFSN